MGEASLWGRVQVGQRPHVRWWRERLHIVAPREECTVVPRGRSAHQRAPGLIVAVAGWLKVLESLRPFERAYNRNVYAQDLQGHNQRCCVYVVEFVQRNFVATRPELKVCIAEMLIKT